MKLKRCMGQGKFGLKKFGPYKILWFCQEQSTLGFVVPFALFQKYPL